MTTWTMSDPVSDLDMTSVVFEVTTPFAFLLPNLTTSTLPTVEVDEPNLTSTISTPQDDHCLYFSADFHVTTAVICGMYLLFGVVYTLYGYRCFRASMFLTGFLFGSLVVYVICTEEDVLPSGGNIGIALGAGLLFGLVTMLVQYVGLFMTGLHLGLFMGVAVLLVSYPWWTPHTIWIVVGLLLGCGLLGAVSNLFWQKGLTILGTSVYGGAILAVSVDYFTEKFIMLLWIWDRIRLTGTDISGSPCWFSWLILAIWPLMVLVGTVTQWRITGRGTHHQEAAPTRHTRQVNLQRIRQEQSKAELRQRKYRYLYQVRTAHGDVISQNYIQSLQKKVCPPPLESFQSDLTHLTILNAADSTNTTLSHIP